MEINKDLSFDYVNRLFNYNQFTGILTWKIKKANRIKVGHPVGFYDTGGYLRVWVNSKTYSLHRIAWIIMAGSWPDFQIDHINGVRDDNRWENLRSVTAHENSKNQAKPKNNTSGFIGVSYLKLNKKYAAYIRINGKKKHLGYFDNAIDAFNERKKASSEFNYHENHGR
jgi:hypothetical protein